MALDDAVTVEVVQSPPINLSLATVGLQGPAGPSGATGAASTVPGPAMPIDFEGTGFPEGVVTATVGKTYRDNAGTNGAWLWVKATGAGNTGWKVTYGDTGVRNISSIVTGSNPTPSFVLSRTNETVFLSGRGGLSVSGYGAILLVVPTGFRPHTTDRDDYFWWQDYGTFKTAFFDTDGTFRLGNGPTLNAAVSVRLSYRTTQPWPATLPGTAA